jgi:hypothetical protein
MLPTVLEQPQVVAAIGWPKRRKRSSATGTLKANANMTRRGTYAGVCAM